MVEIEGQADDGQVEYVGSYAVQFFANHAHPVYLAKSKRKTKKRYSEKQLIANHFLFFVGHHDFTCLFYGLLLVMRVELVVVPHISRCYFYSCIIFRLLHPRPIDYGSACFGLGEAHWI